MEVEKKSVLIACLANPSGNPRPFRTIWLLNKMNFEVSVLSPSFNKVFLQVDNHFEINKKITDILSKIKRNICIRLWKFFGVFEMTNEWSEYFYWSSIMPNDNLNFIKAKSYDLIIVEDLPLLSGILKNKCVNSKVFFDAREYFPREIESSFFFRIFDKPRVNITLKKCIPLLNEIYTVGEILAAEFLKDFGVLPKVIRSVPFYFEYNCSYNIEMPFKMVHHGNANNDRGLEYMIEVVKELSGLFYLDFYLVGDVDEINKLKSVASNCEWIFFKEAVDFNNLVNILSNYDLGFYLLQPTSFNTKNALPNKFFEFIQARLGVIIGPSPEMMAIVNKYENGFVSKDFSVQSMVSLLKSLKLDDVAKMNMASNLASKELCWEKESLKLENMINNSLT
jgi:hypothetical protein